PLAVVQVRMADPARLDLDDCLARTRIRHDDVDHLHRDSLGAGDDSLDSAGHAGLLWSGVALRILCSLLADFRLKPVFGRQTAAKRGLDWAKRPARAGQQSSAFAAGALEPR